MKNPHSSATLIQFQTKVKQAPANKLKVKKTPAVKSKVKQTVAVKSKQNSRKN